MRRSFHKRRRLSSRSISEEKALDIAQEATKAERSRLEILGTNPGNLRIYNGGPSEPAWYVYAPWGDGLDGMMIRSSRIVIISKKTGKILCKGRACDEG